MGALSLIKLLIIFPFKMLLNIIVNIVMSTDYNECLDDMGGCNQICNNLIPYFNCSCYAGYTLAQDNRTCIRMLIKGVIMFNVTSL